MYKYLFFTCLLTLSFNNQAAIIMQDGDSFSSSFTLQSVANDFKLSDSYWEVIVGILDEDNAPFTPGPYTPSSVTLTLFEDQNLGNQAFSLTQDTRDWASDDGVLFIGFDGLFSDFDGSFTVTYNGGTEATLLDITIKNFAGTLTPSNIARASIIPTASPVPVPGAVWLMASGLLLLSGVAKRRGNAL